MAKATKSAKVPPAMQEKFDQITALTDNFAQQHLDNEYAQLIRFATAALCRKRPSPLNSGKPVTWACGITHADQAAPASADALYTLDVCIVDGPVTEKLIKKNPLMSRTIAIKGDQTLADLHRIIFQAFDREEEHMYEFQVGGAGPNDPQAQRYGLPMAFSGDADDQPTGDVNHTTIAANSMINSWAMGKFLEQLHLKPA
jgi:Domain of unknown function (DUF6398)/Plasmid pRiA4b ORF-3-like protein